MKTTLLKLLSGAGLAIALSPSSALAVSLTPISYVETNQEFRAEFKINILENDGIFMNLPPGANLWRMVLRENPNGNQFPFPLMIQAFHSSKVNDINDPTGGTLIELFPLGFLTDPAGTVFQTSVDYSTTEGVTRQDIYQLDYTKDPSTINITNFVFTGRQVRPVPEPLTMLGSAAALGFGGLFQRQKSKKKNKAV